MRLSPHTSNTRAGFTLTETLVTMSVMLLVLAGVIMAHLMGIRMFEITKAKLGASDEARQAISMLIDEIRSAKLVKVGNGSLASFTEIAPNQKQEGSAIQIYPTVATNQFIRYFWDQGDHRLKRTTNGASSVSIVANSITNALIFSAENFKGQVLTNNENNRVIGMTLQFYQIQYPIVLIGPGQYYDFYQLRTKITRRALE